MHSRHVPLNLAAAAPLRGILLLICLGTLALGGLSCDKDSTTSQTASKQIEDFIPPGSSDMPQQGVLVTYSTLADLAAFINGFQAQYAHGFQELKVQEYIGDGGALDGIYAHVSISDQTDEANATQVMDEILAAESWLDIAEFSIPVYYQTSFAAYVLMFAHEKYVGRFEIYSGSEDAKTKLESFVTHVLLEMEE